LKVVIDTNVLMSGIFFTGPPFEILQKWHQGKFEIVISPAIEEEYNRVAQRLNSNFPDIDIRSILEIIKNHSKSVNIFKKISNVCSDPHDDKFFECAVNSDCTLIISGDRHLLDASGFMNIRVLKPRDFLDKYFKK